MEDMSNDMQQVEMMQERDVRLRSELRESAASAIGDKGRNVPQVGSRAVADYNKDLVVGTISFIGPTSFASGEWVGIVLDTPSGKNDGSVKGKRYFVCKPNHGLFVRPHNVRSMLLSFLLGPLAPPEVILKHAFKAFSEMVNSVRQQRELRLELNEAAENNDLDGLRSILPRAEACEVDQTDIEHAKRRMDLLEQRNSMPVNGPSAFESCEDVALERMLLMQERILCEVQRMSNCSLAQSISELPNSRVPLSASSRCSPLGCPNNKRPPSGGGIFRSPDAGRNSSDWEMGAPFLASVGPNRRVLSLAEKSLLRNASALLCYAGLNHLQDATAMQEFVEDCGPPGYVTTTMAMSTWARTPNRWLGSVGGLKGVNPFTTRTSKLPNEVIDRGQEQLAQERTTVVEEKRKARQSKHEAFRVKMFRGSGKILERASKRLVEEPMLKKRVDHFAIWVEAQLTANAEIAALGDDNWTPACLGDGGGVFFADGPSEPTTQGIPVFLGPLPRVRKATLQVEFPAEPMCRPPLPMRSYHNSVLFSVSPQWEPICHRRRPPVLCPRAIIPEMPVASYVARSTITVHVGGAGCGISSPLWIKLAAEHGVDAEGNWNQGTCGSLATHFYETSQGRFVPRAVLVDARPTGACLPCFPACNVIRGDAGCDGNWAEGFYGRGKVVAEAAMECLRTQLEMADSVNGIVLTFAGYGGAGGGITSGMLKQLSKMQPKLPTWSFCLAPPSQEAANEPEYKGTMGAYNMVFTVKSLLDTSPGIVTFADNEALRRVAGGRDGVGLAIANPSNQNCNELLGGLVASVMSPLRIGLGVPASEGTHLAMQRKIETSLVPYPRIKFTVPSFAPLISAETREKGGHSADPGAVISSCIRGPRFLSVDTKKGKFISNGLFLRDLPHFTGVTKLNEWKALHPFVDWCPGGKLVSSHRDPTVRTGEAALISNHTSLGDQFFRPLVERFNKSFVQKSELDKYVCAGMAESDFNEAVSDITGLIDDYKQVEVATGEALGTNNAEEVAF
eukprot:TRINITY_DN38740_c0_g1_i1.p1 TRINITY_DN38740_c0_g1~~TRINITY_DN38740_c0_g1_i1.p1  ORF type:complete len:1017 (-),score=124.91 TRINITY_DN38740_c0_g1_i1:164-3214(-)